MRPTKSRDEFFAGSFSHLDLTVNILIKLLCFDSRYGEGKIDFNQHRLPFDISIESLEPFMVVDDDYNYSSAGMRLFFTRNEFGLLMGGYYVPTFIFALLSLVSYSIDADMVRDHP